MFSHINLFFKTPKSCLYSFQLSVDFDWVFVVVVAAVYLLACLLFWLSNSPVVLSRETQPADDFNSVTPRAANKSLQSWQLREQFSNGNQCTEIKTKPGACCGDRPESWRDYLYKWKSGLALLKSLSCARSHDYTEIIHLNDPPSTAQELPLW